MNFQNEIGPVKAQNGCLRVTSEHTAALFLRFTRLLYGGKISDFSRFLKIWLDIYAQLYFKSKMPKVR